MSVSILAISNANAKKVAKRGTSLNAGLLPESTVHHFTKSPDDLMPLFQEAAQKNLRHLVIEGGDGTVRTILTALLNSCLLYTSPSPRDS